MKKDIKDIIKRSKDKSEKKVKGQDQDKKAKKENKIKNKSDDKPENPKKSKKTIIIIVPLLLVAAAAAVFLFLFGPDYLMTGKAEKSAMKSVEGMFDSFKTLDFGKAEEYIDMTGVDVPKDYTPFTNLQMIRNVLFDRLNGQIVSSERIDENTVTVKTNVTAVRIKPVMAEFAVKVLDFTIRDLRSENPLSDKEKEKKINELLEACASKPDLETVTNEVDIVVKYVNDAWMVVSDDSLINALYGGIIDVAGDLFSADPEPVPELDSESKPGSGSSGSH